MSRKPIPDQLKVLAGTFRKDREIQGLPEFESVESFPAAPSYLGPDGVEMWNDLGPKLVAAGVLKVVHLYPLEQLCHEWQMFREKAKAKEDITAAQYSELRGLFAEFGMTPASARKVAAGDSKKPGNKFAGNGKRRV